MLLVPLFTLNFIFCCLICVVLMICCLIPSPYPSFFKCGCMMSIFLPEGEKQFSTSYTHIYILLLSTVLLYMAYGTHKQRQLISADALLWWSFTVYKFFESTKGKWMDQVGWWQHLLFSIHRALIFNQITANIYNDMWRVWFVNLSAVSSLCGLEISWSSKLRWL